MPDQETVALAMTRPALTDKNGVELSGGYPINHRLRAEALFADGKASDPGGLIDDNLIVAAGERKRADDRDAEIAAKQADADAKAREKAEKADAAAAEKSAAEDAKAAKAADAAAAAVAAAQTNNSEAPAGDAGKGA